MSDSEENLSDISLDEEDEELIWRVFYGDVEKRQRSNTNSGYPTDESESEILNQEDDDENESISDLSEVDDLDLVAKYEELKSMEQNRKRKREDRSTGDSHFGTPSELTDEERKRLIIGSFSNDQMDRFESYRRMTINKLGVKKICNSVLGHSIGQNIAVVLAGVSKLFLGEIITRAFEIQERDYKARLIVDIDNKKRQKRDILKSLELGKEEVVEVDDRKLQYFGDREIPLQPEHIREAWRMYKLENSGDLNAAWRTQGDSDGKMFR